ncbi:NAD(P)-dependent oxidoreductase [Thioalkalivibrio sp. XN8]|uniref:NAD(P)-binding domain-containing protein n=1 Tax=Thioalkalivibrio sp. XN8 TaxID=2712863 RepID=UPI0013EE0672|nr:NAD(P)-dependent oxidoreductase [Thioalkalivibrio sp. XN8]
MLRVGFIGLGAMGLPMALNLHRAGLLVGAWNRTRARAEALAAETGATAAANPAELAAGCDVLVTCVSADDDLLEVIDAVAPALPAGAVVVDCSTVAAATARAAAAKLAAVGAGFLDCPVSGGTEGAAAGTLSIMVGGDETHLAAARPALEAMGGSIVHLGPVGAGQAAKATNQIMVAGINQAVTEALAFGRAQGLPMDRLITALEQGAAGNWFLSRRGPTMIRGEYPLGFKVGLHAKDLEICRRMAAELGVKLPVVEMTLLHYARLPAPSADEDISALFRLKSDMFDASDD